MSTDQNTGHPRRQTAGLLIVGVFVVLISLFFGLLFGLGSLSRFRQAEAAWEVHNAHATAVANALENFNRHTGYGGFIHNFKNLVLRRDLPRYQQEIEANIVGLRADLDHLDTLIITPEDETAIAQLRATFEKYATSYANAHPMLAAGASSDEIDAVVKVDDGPALAALALLRINASARAEQAQQLAQATHTDAQRFARIGGGLMLTAILAAILAIVVMMLFQRRIVAANQIIRRANESLQQAASVFSHTREGITITDVKGAIVDVNEAFTRITGYSREEVIGQNPRILSSGKQDAVFYSAMWNALTKQGHWSGEIWNRHKNGEVYAALLTISAIRDGQGAPQRYVALFSDITASKSHQSQLEHIAHFDSLTHLPNRVLLADRLHQTMAQTQRHGKKLAVAYLDLDGFKLINDTHGHQVGDHVLIALAKRMKEALREGDTLARIGGDEFVAVLIDLEDMQASTPLLNRLLAAAALPVQLGELHLQVSASIGITFYPQEHDIDADQLLRQADQAMYQAKVAGKNRYYVFDAAHDSSIRVYHESTERIRQALAQGEFVLHYQPKVNMHSGKIIGAEALIRWQHPDKGLLTPAAFLPLIEDHPLVIDVGEWVIDTAMHQIEVWHAAGLDLPVSVNLSARQLLHDDFVERLQAILARHPQVPPSCIELEVLETSALADMAQASRVIDDCARMGVRFALDDFGTGYSSLTYLKRLKVALLKIDQSFVRDMLDDPDDLAILQGIIGLAVAFNREVIAEGVESVAHGTALLQLGCELAQGYGIARPMTADQLPAWITDWHPDTAWGGVMSSDEITDHN